MAIIKNKQLLKNRRVFIGLVMLVVVLGILFVLEKKHVTNFVGKDISESTTESDAKTTSTAPTAQEDFSDGDERLIPDNNKDEGIVQDNSGSISAVPDKSQWSVSADKAITVYSPAKNTLIKNGSTISGESTLPRVYFRLIDDVSGVISQGSLSVVNGKFSGTFNFSTEGTNGRLDVFNASSDGVESSNVEVPVRYK